MDYSQYRKIIESENEIDSDKRKELLSIYLKTPSLPQLQAARALLFEIKAKLSHCETSKKKCLKAIRRMLYNKGSV
ncbi:MAG: hypothetical protein OXD54_18920 [Candidatus Poribacteria bacterium]|nr:hypothetical protein [Candidatus Poribacteria bacterium]